MKTSKTVILKSDHSYSQEALSGKIWGFWISGCLREGVAYGGSVVFQKLYNSYWALYYM